jgi:hypothetical protein
VQKLFGTGNLTTNRLRQVNFAPKFFDRLNVEDGSICRAEASVTNYQPTPRNITEEQRPLFIIYLIMQQTEFESRKLQMVTL